MSIVEYLKTEYEITLEVYEYEFDASSDVESIIFCSFCLERISGPFYSGRSDYVFIDLHDSCAHSSAKVKHPLHPHHNLWIYYDLFGFDNYFCDGCFTYSSSLKYRCKTCKFSLDFPCFNSKNVEPKERAEKLTRYHPHKLLPFYLPLDPPILKATGKVTCCCCVKGIQDSGYICPRCGFFIHESCLATLPEQFNSSFHPRHPLRPFMVEEDYEVCNACKRAINFIALGCRSCWCWFHVSCGKYTRPGLKYDEDTTFFYLDEGFEIDTTMDYCHICHEWISKGPIYRHIESVTGLHVECIASHVLDHECHHHQLVLTDSVVPKDNHEYYDCDVCEEKEVFNHYVYHSKECNFMTY